MGVVAQTGSRFGVLGRRAILLIAALLGLFYAQLLGRGFGIEHLSNDGMQYVVSARHIMAGQGVTTGLQTYPAQQVAPPPVAQRVWPPAYPVALAALASVVHRPVEAVVGPFALWCVFMSGVLIWLIARDFGAGSWAGAVPALIWWLLPMPIVGAGGGQSESLFTLFTLAFVAVLGWRGRAPAAIGDGAALLAGLFLSLAFLTRYQGLAFVAAMAVLSLPVLLLEGRKRPRLLAAAFPFALVSAQLALNWWATGSVRAGSDNRGDLAVGEILWQVQFGLRAAFGLDADWPAPLPAMLALFSWLLLAAALVLTRRRRPWLLPTLGWLAAWPVPLICAAMAAALFAMHLLMAATNGATYPFEPRYMEASVALALLAGTGLGIASLRRLDGFGRRAVAVGTTVMLALWIVAITGSARDAGLPFETRARDDVAHLLAVMKSPVQGRSLAQFLREHTDAHHGLLAADGQVLGMLLERPVAALTEPAYADQVWHEAAAQALACRLNARWLVVFPALLAAQASTRQPEDVIARLSRGDGPAGWTPVVDNDDVRILTVCPSAQR
ncbi:MAG: hypothetical protein R3E87_26645 [Burkholderiaceae bacterium]